MSSAFPRWLRAALLAAGLLPWLAHAAVTAPASADAAEAGLPKWSAEALAARAPAARPADVASPRALVLALHDAISGPGKGFDWQRFQALFLPTAQVGEAGTDGKSPRHVMYMPAAEWIKQLHDVRFQLDVAEHVFKIRIEQFDNVASAYYSHDTNTSKNPADAQRRVNICQMVYDGRRWWIASVIWNISPKSADLPADMRPDAH